MVRLCFGCGNRMSGSVIQRLVLVLWHYCPETADFQFVEWMLHYSSSTSILCTDKYLEMGEIVLYFTSCPYLIFSFHQFKGNPVLSLSLQFMWLIVIF